ncbi:hypothetical protein PUF88_02275 [Lactobacillaceae bacterium L1_55_11]|nr:hypothetical protein [Lactobacillaceae bacterium L1_55_11]
MKNVVKIAAVSSLTGLIGFAVAAPSTQVYAAETAPKSAPLDAQGADIKGNTQEVKNSLDNLKASQQAVQDNRQDIGSKIGNGLLNKLDGLDNFLIQAGTALSKLGDSLTAFNAGWGKLTNAQLQGFNQASDTFIALANQLTKLNQGLAHGIGSVGDVENAIASVVNGAANLVKSFNNLVGAVGNVIPSVTSGFSALASQVAKIFGSLV